MKKQWIVIMAMTAALLSGCNRAHIPEYIKNPTIENLSRTQRDELKNIENSGIQVVKQGVLFTFYIPTDCFFEKDTREIKSHRYKDLLQLAKFVDSYSRYLSNPRVFVTGYTDKVWLYDARMKLSKHYARNIADFFSENGVQSEIMVVRGLGSEEKIASNRYPKGTAFNRRVVVEIR